MRINLTLDDQTGWRFRAERDERRRSLAMPNLGDSQVAAAIIRAWLDAKQQLAENPQSKLPLAERQTRKK